MAKQARTESFVVEIPLRVHPHQERALLVRLEAGRQVYNAVLGESLKRLALLRQSKAYQAASRLPRGEQRTHAFWLATLDAGFREYSLYAYTKQFGRSWIGQHIDANTRYAVAAWAFQAVQQYAFGKRGRPRFKGRGQFDCIQGKTNTQGIRWRDNQVVWKGLRLHTMIDDDDPVIAHGLRCRIKFVKLVRRKINGRNRFSAHLTCEGTPYQKPQYPLGNGTMGIDPGPRVFGIAGAAWGVQIDLTTPLQTGYRHMRLLQRKIDRQRRSNNPHNYLPDGRVRRGARQWNVSHKQRRIMNRLAEQHRKEAAHRKSLHGQLVNSLLTCGDRFQIEQNSYRFFQRSYGTAVSHAAPATFVRHLVRKAESAGASVTLIPTSLRLSQTCHACGRVIRKSLKQRVHSCTCGIRVQRDIYSAWLARFAVLEKSGSSRTWRLDAAQAASAWAGAESRLPVASCPISVAAFIAQLRGQSANDGPPGIVGPVPSDTRTEWIAGAGITTTGKAQNGVRRSDPRGESESTDPADPGATGR